MPARALAPSQAASRAEGPAEGREEAARQLDPRVGQLGRAGAGGNPRELRDGAQNSRDRVKEHLGRQPAGDRVRVVRLVVLVPLVRLDRKLVGPRLADQRDHVAGVEAALEELLGEVVEQRGVGGCVPRADVVDRLDDPDAEQVAPESVDVAPGEVWVVGRGDPGGQLLAAGCLRVGLEVTKGKPGTWAASTARSARA